MSALAEFSSLVALLYEAAAEPRQWESDAVSVGIKSAARSVMPPVSPVKVNVPLSLLISSGPSVPEKVPDRCR
jgi:hypothetical protein